jgi:hypothetical protein
MAIPRSNLQWWDREFDDQGKHIREDVREAAHEIWGTLCARVRATLGDAAEAPELMEAAVAYISKHLDHAAEPPPPGKAKRLLGLHFSQLLHKRAFKLRRLECVGTAADLDSLAPILDWDWVTRVNRWLDLEKVQPIVGSKNFTLFAMRRLGHDWDEVTEKTGIPPAKARATFWQAIRKARNILQGSEHPSGQGGAGAR